MQSFSLRSKIYIGFAAIVCLMVANAWIGRNGLTALSNEVSRSQTVARFNADIGELTSDVQELRLRVDRYIESGSGSTREEVSTLHQNLLRMTGESKSWSDPELLDLYSQIRPHIETHRDDFQIVVAEREIRSNLLLQELPEKAAVVRERISQNLSRADDSESEASTETNTSSMAFISALSNFTQAEKDLLRYFADPDGKLVQNSLNLLTQCKAKLGETTAGSQKDVIQAVDDYQSSALRAVQATRSYLFMRGVVMSGEASEIQFYSSRLRDLANARQTENEILIASRTNEISTNNLVGILLTAVLAAAAAVYLTYIIIPPITNISQTLNELATGSVLKDIPSVNRHDEIGEMARAAQVFSEKNQTSLRLLAESKQLSKELSEQTMQLKATNEELDNFAYIASHDLKSPLRGISQLAEWIEEDADTHLSPKSDEYMSHLTSRIDKMERLLGDLLDFSRVGRIAPSASQVDLNETLQRIVILTNNPKNVQIVVPENLPVITTFALPLEQVLLNLISNAVKYNDKDSEGWVKVSVAENGDDLNLCVVDNGIGIAPRYHERIFQMYQRVGPANIQGTGMGLAIVKKQVDHIGGQISVESAEGKGSTFRITWPKLTSN